MKELIIHVGTPRTGTTTLQKNAFNKLVRYEVYSKMPFTAKGLLTDEKGKSKFTIKWMQSFIQSIQSSSLRPPNHEISDVIRVLSQTACHVNGDYRSIASGFLRQLISRLSFVSDAPVLLSNERLCDCSASLNGDSRHTKDIEFAVYPLLRSIKEAGVMPLIVICLREPISYLRSKYLRTIEQRKSQQIKHLTLKEYIEKQLALELTCPGSSIIAHAMHSSMIQALQRYSFVKAFGFNDLLNSGDVFNLMGLVGERKIAFSELSFENSSELGAAEKKSIDLEIIDILRVNGWYSKILDSQMFDCSRST